MSDVMRVAVIGSGPAGFYSAESLLRSGRPIEVDVFEKLPTPYGLVRAGVAPDHQKMKSITKVFDKIAAMPGFAFRGNITVGRDISIGELKAAYDAVLIATGASQARALDIPGAGLTGCHPASDFVGWCNGHPDFVDLDFDLSGDTAVVIGHGNVAADICRLLLKSPAHLAQTDITSHALAKLGESRLRHIHLIGRSAPAQVKFGSPELSELCRLDGCTVRAHGDFSENSAPTDPDAVKNWRILSGLTDPLINHPKQLHFHFNLKPAVVHGPAKVSAISFTRAGDHAVSRNVRFDCDLVISSIGYRSASLEGVPFDLQRCIIPNDKGRVLGEQKLYVSGWIKRGPSGVIGTNRGDSVETVKTLLDDLSGAAEVSKGFSSIEFGLALRGIRTTGFADWQHLDALEIERGRKSGKSREKFVRISHMLDALPSQRCQLETI